MKKLFFLIILFVTVSLINVYAAPTPTKTPTKTPASKTTTINKPSLQWHCLNNVVCSAKGASCATGEKVVPGHRVKLKTKDSDLPSRNTPTYIFVCVSTKLGNVCTSQNGSLDQTTLGYNGVTKLKEAASFEPQGVFRPKSTTPLTQDEIKNIKTNSSGRLTLNNTLIEGIEMQDYTPQSLGRKWVALNVVETKELPSGKGGDQQGTFTFEGALAQCIAISWDPYGIVFDSQSLEPVPGVTVTLNKLRANGKYTLAVDDDIPSILNPVTTFEDGAFEFFVPNGTYRLDLNSSSFNFPSLKTKLNPNYSSIYSEIYRGEDIIEKGKTEHRDVPIDSKGLPFKTNPKVMSYSTMLDKGTNNFYVQGRVSHPLTIIKVYGKKPSTGNTYVKTKLIGTFHADKVGQFDVLINMNKLEVTEVVGDIDFIKPDYNNLSKTPLNETNKTTLTVEPITNYVRGYAYDDYGKPLTNTTVGIYLNQATSPIFETKTDEKGYYEISSEYVPPMSFGMKYTKPTGVSYLVPMTKYLAQNAKFIEDQKESLFAYRDKNGIIKKNLAKNKTTTNSDGLSIENEKTEISQTLPKNNTNNLLVIIAVFLIFVGILGIVLAFYLMKKKDQV